MTKPLVSIASIAYNHEKYIAQAIDSWLMQKTMFPIEIVIGEDVSSDNTRSILLAYQKQHPDFIRLIITDKNVGMMPNFIRTLQSCKGKYIALCEGDDYWGDPYKLQKQVDFLESNPGYVLTYHNSTIIDENGNITKENRLTDIKTELTKEDLVYGHFIPTQTLVIRNVIKTFPKDFLTLKNGDKAIISLLGQYGKGKYIDTVKNSFYRVHDGGVWSLISFEKKLVAGILTLNTLVKHAPLEFKKNMYLRRNYVVNELLKELLKNKKIIAYLKYLFKFPIVLDNYIFKIYTFHFKELIKEWYK